MRSRLLRENKFHKPLFKFVEANIESICVVWIEMKSNISQSHPALHQNCRLLHATSCFRSKVSSRDLRRLKPRCQTGASQVHNPKQSLGCGSTSAFGAKPCKWQKRNLQRTRSVSGQVGNNISVSELNTAYSVWGLDISSEWVQIIDMQALGWGLFFTPGLLGLVYSYVKGKGNVKDGFSRLLTEVSQGYFQPNVGGETIPVAEGELSDLVGGEPLFKALFQWWDPCFPNRVVRNIFSVKIVMQTRITQTKGQSCTALS